METRLLSRCLTTALLVPLLCAPAVGDEYQRGSANDPLLRSARYRLDTGHPFLALSEALYAAGRSRQPGSPALSSLLLRGAQSFGIDAEVIGSTVPMGFSPEVAAGTADSNDLYRRYNRGATLIQAGHPAGLQMLEAIALAEFDSEDSLLLRDKTNLALGFHHLKARNNAVAAEAFRRVRRLSPYATRALVGLGWASLNPDASGEDSKSQPAQANTDAFLWSASEDDVAWLRRRAPFRHSWSIVSGEKEKDLRNAMVPWMELVAGDAFDPAVQEGMLIIPYALTHFGALDQATDYYRDAASRLQHAIGQLQAAANHVGRGELIAAIVRNDNSADSGWDQWLCRLVDARQTAYVKLLLSNPDFLDALTEFRELREMHTALARHRQRLAAGAADSEVVRLQAHIESLLARLDTAIAESRSRLERQALAELDDRRRRAETYLAEAGFALARAHDAPRQQVRRFTPGDGA